MVSQLGSLIAIHDFGAGEIAELAPRKAQRSWFLLAVIRLIAIDMTAKELCLSVPDGFA